MRTILAALAVSAVGASLVGCASTSRAPTRGLFDDVQPQSAPGAWAESAPTAISADESESGGWFGEKEAKMAADAPAPPPAPPQGAMGGAMSGAPAASAPEPAPSEASTGAEPSVPAPGARLMIYTGNATVLVPSVQEAQQKLTARIEALGGYVQSASGDTSSNTATVTYRVPVAKFFEVKNELPTYGQVLNDTVQAEDVTKQVFDLEIRLDNATKSRERLVELLKQAQKMEDILQIEAEIRRLTDEIEGLKGQLRFLKDRVSFSTLTVSLYSNAPPPVTGPRRTYSRFGWINQVGPERVLNDF